MFSTELMMIYIWVLFSTPPCSDHTSDENSKMFFQYFRFQSSDAFILQQNHFMAEAPIFVIKLV